MSEAQRLDGVSVHTVPMCWRAVSTAPLTVADAEAAYTLLRRFMLRSLSASDAAAFAAAAEVIADWLSVQ